MHGTCKLAAAALVVSLAACGNNAGSNAKPSSPTTADPARTIATTAVPTTLAPTAGGAPGPVSTTVTGTPAGVTQFPCPPLPPVPLQSVDQSVPVDFDGNGTLDSLRVYQLGGAWHVRGEVGGQGFHDQVLTAFGGGPVVPLFGARVNPTDSTEESWVKVGSGAATDIVTLFVFRGCALVRVALNGSPVELPVGFTVTHANGVSCFMFDQAIEVFDTTSTDGVTYQGQSNLYTLDPGSSPSPTLNLVAGWPKPVPQGNPQSHLWHLTCGSRVFP